MPTCLPTSQARDPTPADRDVVASVPGRREPNTPYNECVPGHGLRASWHHGVATSRQLVRTKERPGRGLKRGLHSDDTSLEALERCFTGFRCVPMCSAGQSFGLVYRPLTVPGRACGFACVCNRATDNRSATRTLCSLTDSRTLIYIIQLEHVTSNM